MVALPFPVFRGSTLFGYFWVLLGRLGGRLEGMRVPLLLPILVVMACHPERPEAQVKRAYEDTVKAVEAGDASEAASFLAKDFSGPEGMSKADAKLFLLGILNREKIGVTTLGNRVNVRGNQAEQNLEVMLTSRSGSSGLLPDETSKRVFLLSWERQEGKWTLRELRESR
jgi:hypothetical protein